MANVSELKESRGKVKLIDCRTIEEFKEVRVPGAIHLPLSEIEERNFPEFIEEDEFFYIICRSGKRSQRACDILGGNGVGKPENVEGGTLAWIQAGFETEEG